MEFRNRKNNRFENVVQSDKDHEERKGKIFEALKIWVAGKIAANPEFNIIEKDILDFMKEHRELFPTQVDYFSVVRYLGGSMPYLREKLGLPKFLPKPPKKGT